MRNEFSGKPDIFRHLWRAQKSNFYLLVEASPDIVLSTFCVAINKRGSSLDVNYRKGVLSSQAVFDAICQRHRGDLEARVNHFVFNRQVHLRAARRRFCTVQKKRPHIRCALVFSFFILPSVAWINTVKSTQLFSWLPFRAHLYSTGDVPCTLTSPAIIKKVSSYVNVIISSRRSKRGWARRSGQRVISCKSMEREEPLPETE